MSIDFHEQAWPLCLSVPVKEAWPRYLSVSELFFVMEGGPLWLSVLVKKKKKSGPCAFSVSEGGMDSASVSIGEGGVASVPVNLSKVGVSWVPVNLSKEGGSYSLKKYKKIYILYTKFHRPFCRYI